MKDQIKQNQENSKTHMLSKLKSDVDEMKKTKKVTNIIINWNMLIM